MCFSREASFGASGVLLVIGSASLLKTTKPRQILLAATPLIFAVQQFSEGVLWSSFGHTNLLLTQKIATYVFVIFGQIFWPIWIPLVAMTLETEKKRLDLIKVSFGLGLSISLFLSYQTIMYGVGVNISGHHIRYIFDDRDSIISTWYLIYLVPTVLSLLISSINEMRILGAMILIGYITSSVFYSQYVFSVWCFFAAIISSYIYFIVKTLNSDHIINIKFKEQHE